MDTLRELVAGELRATLARKRISAAALARRLGWSQTYMARRVDGRSPIDMDDLQAIADELDITPAELLPSAKVRPNNRSTARPVQVTPPTRPAVDRPRSRPTHGSTRPGSPVPPTRRRPTPIHRHPGR